MSRAATTTATMKTTINGSARRQRVRAQLDRVLAFVRPQLAFANCHMVGYLTEGLWQQHMPPAIREAVQSAEDVDAAVALFWAFHREPEQFAADLTRRSKDEEKKPERFAGLLELLRTSRAHRLGQLAGEELGEDVVISADQMHAELQRRRRQIQNKTSAFDYDAEASDEPMTTKTTTLQIKEFMSEKKGHEVEIAAGLIATLCNSAQSTRR